LTPLIFREEISKLGLSILVDTRNADNKKKMLQVIGEALIYFEVRFSAALPQELPLTQ
jgi:predicted component of type VI protein secretion system